MMIKVTLTKSYLDMVFTFSGSQAALEFAETALDSAEEGVSVNISMEKGEEKHESV